MAVVEIVRSFAVASFQNATVVLNLGTGTLFQLEAESAPTVLDIARDMPSAEIEERMALLRKIPRYVARERVRALQLQLASPFTLASSPRLGQTSFIDITGRVNIGQAPGVLRPGEALQWSGAAVRSQEGIMFIGGPPQSGKSLLCEALAARGCEILSDGTVQVPIQRASEKAAEGGKASPDSVNKIGVSWAQAWFIEPQSRAGMGIILARRSPVFTMTQLLTHTKSSHARGAWVEIFKMVALLAEDLPAFRVTLPQGTDAVHAAVADFAGASFRAQAPGVPS